MCKCNWVLLNFFGEIKNFTKFSISQKLKRKTPEMGSWMMHANSLKIMGFWNKFCWWKRNWFGSVGNWLEMCDGWSQVHTGVIFLNCKLKIERERERERWNWIELNWIVAQEGKTIKSCHWVADLLSIHCCTRRVQSCCWMQIWSLSIDSLICVPRAWMNYCEWDDGIQNKFGLSSLFAC
jgi:hypothetical protein